MKLLRILFVCVALVTSATAFKEFAQGMDNLGLDLGQILDWVEQCNDAENIGEDDMNRLMNKQLPITQEGKCFIGCFFEKLGIFHEGVFHSEKAEALYRKLFKGRPELLKIAEATHAICDKPAENSGNDRCINGVVFMECLLKNIPDFGFMKGLMESK